MKVIEEIRLENLRSLIEKTGGVTRFADLCGKQQAQISQLLNRAPDSKTGKPKAIGSAQAREFETAAKKEIGWLDNDHKREPAVVAPTSAPPPAKKGRPEIPDLIRDRAKGLDPSIQKQILMLIETVLAASNPRTINHEAEAHRKALARRTMRQK